MRASQLARRGVRAVLIDRHAAHPREAVRARDRTCEQWLACEIDIVAPKLIVALAGK
jgi:uracil-DNA glycosylase